MRIQLEEIKEHGYTNTFVLDPHALPGMADLEARGELHLAAPVQVSVSLNRIGGMVEVTGRLASVFATSCGRCLKDFTAPLDAAFELTFTKEPITVHADDEGDEEGVELAAEELDLIPFTGDEIDLTASVEEQILLALPIKPLCAPGCKGLCPQCGVDLNETTCNCVPPAFGSKFAALRNLKIE